MFAVFYTERTPREKEGKRILPVPYSLEKGGKKQLNHSCAGRPVERERGGEEGEGD